MQGLGSWNQFLKTSDYLKTCSTSFPGAQSASVSTLNSLRGCWRSTAAAVQGSVSAEADGKRPRFSVAGNALGKCQFIVDTAIYQLKIKPPPDFMMLDISQWWEDIVKWLTGALSLPSLGHNTTSLTMLKPLTVWITTNWGIFLKRWEYQTTLPASWKICMQDTKQQLELHMEQQTGSKLGKK